jgi:hypothetical protein
MDGRIAVRVHQIVGDGRGTEEANTVTDGQVTHVYRLRDGLVQDMAACRCRSAAATLEASAA